MRGSHHTIFRAVAMGMGFALAAFGQPPAEEAAKPAASVAEAQPEIYYLQDDAGRLVPVPGFRYRDFLELMRLKDGLPGQPEPPSIVVESIVITATLPEAGVAVAASRSCPAEVRLAVRQLRPGWVSVPFDLQGFLVSGAPIHEGPGEVFFTAATAAGDGPARLWFNAVPEGGDVRHTVTIPGAVPVESSAVSDTAIFFVPPATASRVEVRSPRKQPVVTVWPASLPPSVTAADAAFPVDAAADQGEAPRGGSLVTIVGASGPLQLRISDPTAPSEPITALPETMVESQVRVDGKTAVIDASVRIDGLPADVSTVRITLPPRTSLRAVREPAELVERSGTAESPVAVVRIDRDPAGHAMAELECERTVDASGRTPFDPLGFTVEGVPEWRQRGRVNLLVEGDWLLEWADVGGNRRIDAPPSFRRAGFVAAFAYDSQPASLPLRVRSRVSRVVVEPEYRYDVGAARIALDGRLRVSVRGAAVSRLVVGLEGWELDEVGPLGLVDASAVTADDGRIVIPFQQGLSGDAVIDFRCSRAVDRAADRVAWMFPAPEASLVGPAAVVIASESDIELVPDAAGIRGLVRQVTPAPLRSDVDRLALVYRLDGGDGAFAAQRRFLDRRVDASIRAQVDVQEAMTYVAETIRFAVAHVPMEFVELRVPEVVARDGAIEIRQGGQLLNPVVELPLAVGADESAALPAIDETRDAADDPGISAGQDDAEAGLQWATVRALLPVPLLGSGEVSVTYEVPTPVVPAETTIAVDVPLAMPVDARIGRQTLQVGGIHSLTVDLRGEDWKRDAAASVAGATPSWNTTRLQDHAPLALAARRQEAVVETVVEAAWLQTRLLTDRREDVAMYAIGTAADRLTIGLPPSATGAVEVWLDGRRVENAVPVDGRITLLLPGGGRSAILVELRMSRPASAPGMTGLERIVLEPPTFPEATQQRRFYWEVDTPSDRHVIVPPARWTGQQPWRWGPFGLERTPLVSRETLADWVRSSGGASPEEFTPNLDAGFVGRRAVFSAVGPPGTESVRIAATWLVVLVSSGPVLVVGLLMVYGAAARSVPVVIGLACLITMLAALDPRLAPLFGQAAVPGVALASLAAAMRLLVAGRGASFSQPGSPGSTLTRAVARPSIIIGPAAERSPESVTSLGRSAS